MTGFCGSATKPCGSCFTPQSATKRLVASALSSGRHSEEPRVVVTRATQTAQNSTGHSRQGFVGLFLVTRCNFSAKQGRNLEFRAFVREGCWASRRRRTTVPFDTQPRRNHCHRGRSLPSPSSFQGCERRLVLQAPRTKIGAPLTRGLLLCGHAKQRA